MKAVGFILFYNKTLNRENSDVLIWVGNILKNITTIELAVLTSINNLLAQSVVHTYQKVVK